MANRTRSSSALSAANPRPANPRATVSVLVGLASVLCLPAGFLLADQSSITIVQSGIAAAPGALLGLFAILLGRRARDRVTLTLGRAHGARTARLGGWLGVLGICLALTGALALA